MVSLPAMILEHYQSLLHLVYLENEDGRINAKQLGRTNCSYWNLEEVLLEFCLKFECLGCRAQCFCVWRGEKMK